MFMWLPIRLTIRFCIYIDTPIYLYTYVSDCLPTYLLLYIFATHAHTRIGTYVRDDDNP